jgi:hypothetical protein
VVRDEPAERRDDTAATPARNAPAFIVSGVCDWRTVEDDEKLTPIRCRC